VSILSRSWHGAEQVVAAVDPTLRLVRAKASAPPYALACVYRARNAQIVADVVNVSEHAEPRLWALDGQPDSLEQWTMGSGTGTRFALANKLLKGRRDGWAVLMDDDVRFASGDLDKLVALTRDLDVDIAQPAHTLGSVVAHYYTRRKPGHIARLTSFVEIGPVVVFSPRALERVTPFPEEGMGWGVSIDWAETGLTMAIIDGVTIRHVGPTTKSDYNREEEMARMQAQLDKRGLRSLNDLMVTEHRVLIGGRRSVRPAHVKD